jgi:lysyl endopeptidase
MKHPSLLTAALIAGCLFATSPASAALAPPESLTAITVPDLDLGAIDEEDVSRLAAGLPLRFAIPNGVSLTPANSGIWETLENGERVWRLRVVAPTANSLNFGFGRYALPQGATLEIYRTADGRRTFRGFTAADNEAHGQLWTPVIIATDVIVELRVPAVSSGAVELELTSINQGYRGFGTSALTKSGSCNLDVVCLDPGDPWRDTTRASGVISTGGSTFCSGSLVNNTSNDNRMFFVTANHCGINSGNAASLVVTWNYENSFCRTPGSAQSGQAGDGVFTEFHSGSNFRVSNSPSDFTLVEMDDPAVPAYDLHWAGWDRSTQLDFTCTSGSPCACIHHPQGDEKRFTYVTVNMVTTSYLGTTSPGNGTHIWAKWALDPPGPFTVPGATEPGSSGSPLYTAERRFIGQLHGGFSACGVTGDDFSDYYGRFSLSWAAGASTWLDAANTGATTTDGIDFSGVLFEDGFETADVSGWDDSAP